MIVLRVHPETRDERRRAIRRMRSPGAAARFDQMLREILTRS